MLKQIDGLSLRLTRHASPWCSCCYLPYPHRSRYDLVGIDNRRVGYLITEHLLQVGSRRIAFMPTRDVLLAAKLVVRDSCGASKLQAPTAEESIA
jgi:hypothetical protein